MKESLRTIFQSPFDIKQWNKLLQNLFKATELRLVPENFENNPTEEGYYLGNIQTSDSYRIGLFHYNIKQGSVANKRVGLRKLVKTFINPQWGEFDAALVVFNEIQSPSSNPVPEKYWRLSFICDIKDEATAPKRYTYVFGNKELLYKTPIDRFIFLKDKGISFENLKKAFSVEALSDEFFDKYREQYADFIQYITGKRFVKNGSKWEEKNVATPNHKFMQAFGNDEKKIRDYIKKMMGRITFLHFLQRKGWMCGDLNYMQNLFQRSSHQDDYLDAVLEPLFFGILNTKPEQREALFERYSWDKSLLAEWRDIPYLNGGLFERDENDEPESKFPAEYFERLFNFFSEYNFTIDENDPNDAEVGVDPEMLGKIFENLLEDNKDKGAFYTPKEIVRYMCQESLIAYLETNTSIAKEKIRNFVLSPEEGIADISEKWRCSLIKALENVKICDPAIGSGAFPMGLLNELLHCRQALMYTDNKTTSSPNPVPVPTSQIKKSIIQNNIYGVDIEKGAVDIARLRFWLSIVVDEEEASPLPNLDYKIMQGNSLIESYKGLDLSKLTYAKKSGGPISQYSIFEDDTKQLQREVTQLLTQYYSCSDHDKKTDLRNKISNTIAKQLSVQNFDADILRELRTLDLAGNDQFFLWHTWFSDVFEKGGFDIVIGNPPYVRQEKLGKEYKEQLCSIFPNVGNGIADIYVYFFGLGLKLLSTNGVMMFITLNKYLKTKYGKDLRETLANKATVDLIIDFFELPVFNASTDAAITKVFKDMRNIETRYYPIKTLENLDLFKIASGNYLTTIKDSDEWKFVNDKDELIINKIYDNSISLKEFSNDRIYRGITTGLNKAFVIKDKDIAQRLLNSESSPIIKKYAQSTDIEQWKINGDKMFILATFPALHYNIDDYPTAKEYLLNFGRERLEQTGKSYEIDGEIIASRKKTNNKWFETQDATAYHKEFEQTKIIYIHTAKNHKFYLDKEGYYINNSCYMIVSDSSFLFCFLNSKLFQYFKRLKFVAYGDGQEAGRCKLDYNKMVTVPIKANVDETPYINIIKEVETQVKNNPLFDTSQYEQTINQMIYQTYGLSEEEIKIIEESV